MITEYDTKIQPQIRVHISNLISIIDLVSCRQWDKSEALEMGILPSELFFLSLIGGNENTRQLIDELYLLIKSAKKLCLS